MPQAPISHQRFHLSQSLLTWKKAYYDDCIRMLVASQGALTAMVSQRSKTGGFGNRFTDSRYAKGGGAQELWGLNARKVSPGASRNMLIAHKCSLHILHTAYGKLPAHAGYY